MGWKREVRLTQSLFETIEAAGIPVEAEKRIDLMIGHLKEGHQKPFSVVTLVEVGMGIDNLWKKTDQVVTYADTTMAKANPSCAFSSLRLL
jgi:hypothetical protein